MQHFADRLAAASRERGAVCVGLDPVVERIPGEVGGVSDLERVRRFSLGVVEAVRGRVAAVKPQFACFERYGAAGMEVLEEIAAAARAGGGGGRLLVIADAKRGDIGISAEHYAASFFPPSGSDGGDHPALYDAVTVNPYLGLDGVEPFADAAAAAGGGVFVLVRTSNPGGDALQAATLRDGRSVAELVAAQVAHLGRSNPAYLGEGGMSLVGAVVGATKVEEAAGLRKSMPDQVFLAPGVGAQGGRAGDLAPLFRPDGSGVLITASRSVLYPNPSNGAKASWQARIAAAADELRESVNAVVQKALAASEH